MKKLLAALLAAMISASHVGAEDLTFSGATLSVSGTGTGSFTDGYSGSVTLNSGTLVANQNFLLNGTVVGAGVDSSPAVLDGTLTLGALPGGQLNLQGGTLILSPSNLDVLPPTFTGSNLTFDLNGGVLSTPGAFFTLSGNAPGGAPIYNVIFAPEPPAALLLGCALLVLAVALRRRFFPRAA